VREWREFVAECNVALRTGFTVPEVQVYAQKIREAVIHERISVQEFLLLHPAPWRAK